MKAKLKASTNGMTNGAAPATNAASAEVALLDAPPPSATNAVAGAAPVAEATLTGGAVSASKAQPAGQTAPQGETAPEGETDPIYPHHQSQAQLDMLHRYHQMCNGLDTASDAFRLMMPNYGLTPAFRIAGDSFYEVATGSIADRHRALAAAVEATERQTAAERLARTSYASFRRMARTVVKSGSGRIALGLDEEIPHALVSFTQSAANVLEIAAEEPHATQLANATIDADRLAETATAVQILATAIDQRQAAAAAAKSATEARDAAFANLRTHIYQMRVAVSTILRLYPHLSTPAGF